MDELLQGLEFLDLSDLPENEAQNLKGLIVEQERTDGVQCSPTLPPENNCDVVGGLGQGYGASGVVAPFPQGLVVDGPVPVGFSASNAVHNLCQPNVCITTIPQYQPMSYPVQMFSGAHLIDSSPNFYVSNMPNLGMPHPSNFSPHRVLNSQMLNFPKRKTGRAKYPVRKEVPNGHVGDGYASFYQQPSPYMPCFSGDVVQAVTGVPIVMPQMVPPCILPQGMQVPASTAQAFPMVSIPPPQIPSVPPLPPNPAVVDVEIGPEPVVLPPPVDISPAPVEEAAGEAVSEVCEPPTQPDPISEPAPQEPQGAKSWASLFKKSAPVVVSAEKPTARVEPFTPAVGSTISEGVAVSGSSVDVKTRRLAKQLATYELTMAPLALLPRGLINKGNWCYINATLQALIACSPFVHLMRSLAPFTGTKLDTSATPIMDSVVEFIDQFVEVPIRTGKERSSAKKEEPYFGTSFEPSSIYRMLSKIRSETFKVEGRQEDAEEFLSCLLNGLHDEMLDIMKGAKEESKAPAQVAEAKPGTSDDDDWQVIGPRNRGCVTHTTSYSKTPVSNLFLGLMRSALHYSGAQSTATLQPFFSLQLDIQSEKVNSVRDALACLVSKEPLTGYVCSKTGQEVEASRQTTLEELPPVLILHLKCFVYDKSGGCQKLLKRVDFSSDLELSKDFLSPNQKGKLKERQRQYKLFAVVYHDGKEATKGHYVTEVHHGGTGSWLRFDDSIIRVVDTQLFKYNLPRMPYLLLYKKVNM